MGLPALNRLMSMQMQHDRCHRQIESRVARRKGSLGQQDGNPQGGKRMRYSGPELPMDIWSDILSRLPLRDAVQAGCVSHAFLSAWRGRPNLTFSEETLGLNGMTCAKDILIAWHAGAFSREDLARIFANRVDKIMRKHSGSGVKTFNLRYCGSFIYASYLDRWLQIAVTPGIQELIFSVPRYKGLCYIFPCSLLFNGNGNSIRQLNLSRCVFHPMVGAALGCLTKLHLSEVHITGDELEQLLSNSPAMEELKLAHCHKVISLKIPCLLHRLNYLKLFECRGLQVIENEAPNVCFVHIDCTLERLRVGDLLPVKELEMTDVDETNLVHHARAKLPFIMPNLETLKLYSSGEVSQTRVRQDLISADDSHLRQMPEHRHTAASRM